MKKTILLLATISLLGVSCNKAAPVSQPNQQSTTTLSSTTDWKTYTSTTSSFSVQYPADWQLKVRENYDVHTYVISNKEGTSYVGLYPTGTAAEKQLVWQFPSPQLKDTTIGGVKAEAWIGNGYQVLRLKENIKGWQNLGAERIEIVYGPDRDTVERIVSSTKFITGDSQVSWKDTVYNQFKNLATWKEQGLSDWQLIDLDKVKLNGYEKGKVFELSKSFNDNGFAGGNIDQAGAQQADLETSVKKVLTDNGWKYVAGPTEGGFYHDYLYVKDNHPLVLQIGTRNAVTGGMYVRIEFQY
jgi:hypothetical protein